MKKRVGATVKFSKKEMIHHVDGDTVYVYGEREKQGKEGSKIVRFHEFDNKESGCESLVWRNPNLCGMISFRPNSCNCVVIYT